MQHLKMKDPTGNIKWALALILVLGLTALISARPERSRLWSRPSGLANTVPGPALARERALGPHEGQGSTVENA